jgi:hypothetical protein
MVADILSQFPLDGVFLVAGTVCCVGLVAGLYFILREDRRIPSIMQGQGRTARERLRSVVEQRLIKMKALSATDQLAIPATQREAKRTYQGGKFYLETTRVNQPDGRLRVTVQATQRGRLGLMIRVSDSIELSPAENPGQPGHRETPSQPAGS